MSQNSLCFAILQKTINKNFLKITRNVQAQNVRKYKRGKNIAAVLHGINKLKLEERRIPKLSPNQALIKIEVVGICGSDVHFLTKGRIGPFIVKKPMIIGHEGAGTVADVGKNVKHLKPGDRVAIEPGYPCRLCEFCRTGCYNLCPKIYFCATPPDDGCMCNYYAHEADYCFKLPDNVNFNDAAALEPLSVGIHACRRGGVQVGSKVVVFGSGPIGLVTVVAAKAFGATKVIITDPIKDRLKVAKIMGADHVLHVSGKEPVKELKNTILKTLGCEPNISIDASSAEQCINTALEVTKAGGKAVLVGMGKTEMNLSIAAALFKEVDIVGIFRYKNTWPAAIEMVASGKANLKPMITHKYGFKDTIKAFEMAKSGRAIKVHIHVSKPKM